MSFETTIATVLAHPLAVAGNDRVIGYVGTDVPIELILAAGAQPVRLRGRAGARTELADRFVEESFSTATRRIAEQWLSGELDALAAVIFSRSDDSAQRLYYYVCEWQRIGRCGGPAPLLFDIATLPRASSAAHTLESTRALATAIGTAPERLPDAIARVNRRLSLLERLAEHRVSGDVAGSFALRVQRAAECRWTAAFDDELEHWLGAQAPTASARRRFVLVGSEPSDPRLHESIEAAGVDLVADIHEADAIEASIPAEDDPLAGIAARWQRRVHASRAALRDPDRLAARVRALRADGAILWLLASDTGLAWETPRMERALRNAGCSILKLVLQSEEPDEATLMQLAHFARTTREAQ